MYIVSRPSNWRFCCADSHSRCNPTPTNSRAFFAGTANAMGNKISSAVGMKRREDVSVIDKLTEAQLDEFREAFNSFDKVCAGCGLLVVDVALGREDPLPARTRRNAACV